MSDREYPARPIVGIGIVVHAWGPVLLVRRGKPPNSAPGRCPAARRKLGETAEEAARRELLEETGLEVGALHFAATVDNIRRDEAGRVRFHYTIIDFATRWVRASRWPRPMSPRRRGRGWTRWTSSSCGARRIG